MAQADDVGGPERCVVHAGEEGHEPLVVRMQDAWSMVHVGNGGRHPTSLAQVDDDAPVPTKEILRGFHLRQSKAAPLSAASCAPCTGFFSSRPTPVRPRCFHDDGRRHLCRSCLRADEVSPDAFLVPCAGVRPRV